MNTGYKMDFTNNTLTITKEFEKRAMDVNSSEYNTLKQLRIDFPNLRIVKKTPVKRKQSHARPSYDKMIKYLSCQDNAVTLLQSFADVRERSKAQENPYKYVKDWFLTNFPDYQTIPMLDGHGNIVGRCVVTEFNSIEKEKKVA